MSETQPSAETPSLSRRVLRFAWRWTIRLAWVGLAAALLLGATAALAYQRYIVEDDSEHLSRQYIDAVIAQESPVLYRDGRTPVGVFFAQEHRQYVPEDQLPRHWVDAIVAAEDKRFFEHRGVDPEGLTRAMLQNLRARRVVAGGSTLTQQTAKNLYYRPDRSLRSKWEEMVNALRLEHHYSKRQILEFYANQFHVSANGRGLGIAARYFFDKDVADLDLLECAFLAGMVKGPANYDPFIARSRSGASAPSTAPGTAPPTSSSACSSPAASPRRSTTRPSRTSTPASRRAPSSTAASSATTATSSSTRWRPGSPRRPSPPSSRSWASTTPPPPASRSSPPSTRTPSARPPMPCGITSARSAR